jgi:hypothetical protein
MAAASPVLFRLIFIAFLAGYCAGLYDGREERKTKP